MTEAVFSAKMIESLSYLSKGLLAQPTLKLPKYTSLGDEIKSVSELSAAMGVEKKIAAAYAISADVSDELKQDAEEVLYPGIYNAMDDGFEAIIHHAYSIASKVECKAIRMVRNGQGAKYFGLPVGSIIVADGEQPLDQILAALNDVPGYEKVMDKQGRSYYIGREGGKFVVRSGQSKEVIFQTDKRDGVQESLYWLNQQLGGREHRNKKSMEENLEYKRRFTQLAVERIGKQGHAFRNKNGSYSYPISTVADLKNAIQAYGRSAPEDRERLKTFIKKRARQLGRTDLIPEDWKTGMPANLEEKDDIRSLDRSPRSNWVEETGDLPNYIRAIARALIREHGFTVSRAIATAVNRVKKWSVDPDVSAKTRAKALKALAEWTALKAKNKARVAAKKG